MEIVHQQSDLERYMREAVKGIHDSPVLLDRYLTDAIEVDVDWRLRRPRGPDRRHHGTSEQRRALGRLGLLPAAATRSRSHIERELKRQTASSRARSRWSA